MEQVQTAYWTYFGYFFTVIESFGDTNYKIGWYIGLYLFYFNQMNLKKKILSLHQQHKTQLTKSNQIIRQNIKYLSELAKFHSFNILQLTSIYNGCHNQAKNTCKFVNILQSEQAEELV